MMKRINDLHACLLISIIAHIGVIISGMLQVGSAAQDKPFEVVFEMEEEILPKIYEVKEKKKIEPPVIAQEDIVEPVADELTNQEPKPPEENKELETSLLRYQDSIKQKIQESKKYPRWAIRAGHQGAVRLVIDVLPAGQIDALILEQSSGFDELDREALDAVKRVQPFPAFPESLKYDSVRMEVEIIFVLTNKNSL